MKSIADRIAAAPITWGVCEVPGWGHQISAERFLADIRALGIHATELGPDGFLPTDPHRLAELLDRYGARVVAGFVPAVLYRKDLLDDQLAYVHRAASTLAGVGAEIMVLGPDAATSGYEERIRMDDADWKTFGDGLADVRRIAGDAGLHVALHPHWGMVIETADEIERLLHTTDVDLCLDTGHLALAGADPREMVRRFGDRVAHMHLKDLDPAIAGRVRTGAIGYRDAVARGLYRPLGQGGIDIVGVVTELDRHGYGGWWVLEQDTVLADAEPDVEAGRLAAAASYRFLIEITGRNGRNGRSPVKPEDGYAGTAPRGAT